ncbi:MAG: LysR family transcriptional regulator [Neisseriaceae bacterium]|nr:LysR family transcriptional regulator [Neisseriaceae bacterium]
MNRPSLNALRFFYQVTRSGSLVAASTQLHVTHGAISKQIKQLEAELGVALFHRQHRRLTLTPAGIALQQTCAQVFPLLADCFERIGQQAPKDLVLSCEPTLAMKWLIPRLPDLKAQCPDLNLVILAAGGPIHFQQQGIDVALRRHDFIWPAHVDAIKVADEWMGPVATTPHLSALTRLHTHTRPEAWTLWQRRSATALMPAADEVYFEHFYLSLQAAAAGVGAAMTSLYMVDAELRQGWLQAPYGFVTDESEYFLLSDAPMADDPRKLRLLAWLQAAMADTVTAYVDRKPSPI